jgi:Calcineurin-like phosphoesterase
MISKQTKWRLAGAGVLCLCLWVALSAAQQGQQNVDAATTVTALTQVLGRPTDHSIALSVLAPNDVEAYVEYGTVAGKYSGKTAVAKSAARTPFEIVVDQLKPNTQYYYRLQAKQSGASAYTAATEYSFQTQRPAGSTFTFDVQADSHPERVKNMFDSMLYARTMAEVKKDHPDFYVTLGDDFSIDRFQKAVTPEVVAQVYINQRQYLGMDGSAAPIFLVNGGHEQGAMYLLNGTPNNPAVWAGNSRNRYYPLPAPDGFYSGDKDPVEFVGLLRDYYAFTWGDALFITLDPYWHSKSPVDTAMGEAAGGGDGGDKKGGRKRDMWDITHGEAQYQWLKQTLSTSKAKYKFIFAHHVLGTGRGGVDMADLYEWGGKNNQGVWEFDKKRPGWELPIHQLMAKYGVSIFFQGHDHLFVRQEKDGVVYQETPNPANPNYDETGPQDFAKSYRSGDAIASSGHLRVTVSPENTKVEYVRSWLPKDENAKHKQGEVAFTYSVKPGKQ